MIDADLDGADCDVPALLLTCLPGRPPTRTTMSDDRFCQDRAETLAQIHATGAEGQGHLQSYRLYYDRALAVPPRSLPKLAAWEQASGIVRATPPEPTPTLIHRLPPGEHAVVTEPPDRRGDWTQASWGPAALDLGQMRWSLVLDSGLQLADRFLTSYQTITGHSTNDQRYWDLVSLFGLLLDGNSVLPGDLDTQDQQRLTRYIETLITRSNREHAQPAQWSASRRKCVDVPPTNLNNHVRHTRCTVGRTRVGLTAPAACTPFGWV